MQCGQVNDIRVGNCEDEIPYNSNQKIASVQDGLMRESLGNDLKESKRIALSYPDDIGNYI